MLGQQQPYLPVPSDSWPGTRRRRPSLEGRRQEVDHGEGKIEEAANGGRRGARGQAGQAAQIEPRGRLARDGTVDEREGASRHGAREAEGTTEEEAHAQVRDTSTGGGRKRLVVSCP